MYLISVMKKMKNNKKLFFCIVYSFAIISFNDMIFKEHYYKGTALFLGTSFEPVIVTFEAA